MKKTFLLSVLILEMCLCVGCKAESETDAEENTLKVIIEADYEVQVNEAARFYMKEHPEFAIEIQTLSKEEEKRESEIQKLKTAIMSGDGADVYLLACKDEHIAEESQYDCLFPNVNKTMESGVFATLDDEMEQDDYWENSSYHSEILRAGQYKGEQYIIPLGCSYFVYGHSEEGLQSTFQEWVSQMESGGNMEVAESLIQYGTRMMGARMIQPAVDYETETVNFDAKLWTSEMGNYIKEYQEQLTSGEENVNTTSGFCLGRIDFLDFSGETYSAYDVVPGLTGNKSAAITVYGAVGRTTENKDAAYEFLMLFLNDRLESEDTGLGINGYMNSSGAPVQECAWKTYLQHKGISDENIQNALLESFREIDSAYFPGELEYEMYSDMNEITNLIQKYTAEELEMQIETLATKYETSYQLMVRE